MHGNGTKRCINMENHFMSPARCCDLMSRVNAGFPTFDVGVICGNLGTLHFPCANTVKRVFGITVQTSAFGPTMYDVYAHVDLPQESVQVTCTNDRTPKQYSVWRTTHINVSRPHCLTGAQYLFVLFEVSAVAFLRCPAPV